MAGNEVAGLLHITPIRAALTTHLGTVLTPQVAAFIEQAASASAEVFPPCVCPPVSHGTYTLAVEHFDLVLQELHPLHLAHWQETERYRHGLPLNPDYAGLSELAKRGALVQFTVRHCGVLVGNLRLFIGRSMHTGLLVANEDTLYLAPEHRGGFLVIHLLRRAEAALRAIGVREIRCNSKKVNRSDVLLRRLGYEEVAIQFVKVFGE